MRFFFAITLFLTFGFNLFASDPTWKWAKQVGGNGIDQSIYLAATVNEHI
ncbi:MAG: hypothetical protein IPN93_03715 [Bacteroidetes bacterium]|nr:hypothetical protein [Bacteroidota bacterium]